MSSRMRGGRRGLAAVAGLVFTVGLALTGCDPSATDAATAAATPPAVTAPAAPVATAAPTVTESSPAPVVTAPVPPVEPAPAPTTAEPRSPAPKTQSPAGKVTPEPRATTAKPPAEPEPTQTKAPAGDCEIRSNAGNCYRAGQFCRDDDLGKSTHEAGGRVIYCRMVSGKPHWQA